MKFSRLLPIVVCLFLLAMLGGVVAAQDEGV
ncbi:MAG: hypothetical protein UZ15_CFX003001592, partial [Chloroflexi bacterium OLB15]